MHLSNLATVYALMQLEAAHGKCTPDDAAAWPQGDEMGPEDVREREWLRPRQAARYLGVSSSSLAKWRCSGSGPAFSRAGRAIRYRRTELDAYLESRTVRSTSERTSRAAA